MNNPLTVQCNKKSTGLLPTSVPLGQQTPGIPCIYRQHETLIPKYFKYVLFNECLFSFQTFILRCLANSKILALHFEHNYTTKITLDQLVSKITAQHHPYIRERQCPSILQFQRMIRLIIFLTCMRSDIHIAVAPRCSLA